ETDPAAFTFFDQIIDFPIPQVSSHMIFSGNSDFFKIMYAAANIVSAGDTEMDLIVGGNSPTKVWINDAVVAESPGGSVGNAQQIQHLARVRLKQGDNPIMIKFFCFPLLNEFSVRIAGHDAAQSYIRQRGGIRDLVDHLIIPQGTPLRLTDNLRYLGIATGDNEAQYEIVTANGIQATQAPLSLSEKLEAPTEGLPAGLYTLRLTHAGHTYSHPFYIGAPENIYSSYQARCKPVADLERDVCLSIAGLEEIHQEVQIRHFRQDWQKRALVYASMIENGLNNMTSGFRMHAYRSRVDGQYQFYLFYRPGTVSSDQSLPLVVEVPHNAYGDIVSQDPSALETGESDEDAYYKIKTQSLVSRDANYLLRLAMFCDEYGFACFFPYARQRQFEDPLAITDMLEAFEAVIKTYPIDERRIYLRGFCRGGGNSIKLAEHFPESFAAISSINLSVTPEDFPIWNKEWRESNDIRNMIDRLKDTSLQLVHGKHFPHSPTSQSMEFAALARKQNIPVALELFEGDTQWDDRDEYRISFDYFRDKQLKTNTGGIARAISQQLESQKPMGPVAAAPADSFILVQGTGGTREIQLRSKQTADDIQTYWKGKHFVNLRRVSDEEVTPDNVKNMNLILIGPAKDGTLPERISGKLPLNVQDSLLKIGDYQGYNALVVMLYPNPDNPQRSVVVITSDSHRGFYLPEFDLARYGADVMIWERSVTGQSQLMGQWNWDSQWQKLIALTPQK
ncbi:MAG: hypothetical protein FWF13_05670, partial [Acidobacteria bacterium]|nr:hypothetical protein [Acidobacteriota bacterium]